MIFNDLVEVFDYVFIVMCIIGMFILPKESFNDGLVFGLCLILPCTLLSDIKSIRYKKKLSEGEGK